MKYRQVNFPDITLIKKFNSLKFSKFRKPNSKKILAFIDSLEKVEAAFKEEEPAE
jgi:hypothetical protein